MNSFDKIVLFHVILESLRYQVFCSSVHWHSMLAIFLAGKQCTNRLALSDTDEQANPLIASPVI